jgi:hypothetical protein
MWRFFKCLSYCTNYSTHFCSLPCNNYWLVFVGWKCIHIVHFMSEYAMLCMKHWVGHICIQTINLGRWQYRNKAWEFLHYAKSIDRGEKFWSCWPCKEFCMFEVQNIYPWMPMDPIVDIQPCIEMNTLKV